MNEQNDDHQPPSTFSQFLSHKYNEPTYTKYYDPDPWNTNPLRKDKLNTIHISGLTNKELHSIIDFVKYLKTRTEKKNSRENEFEYAHKKKTNLFNQQDFQTDFENVTTDIPVKGNN